MKIDALFYVFILTLTLVTSTRMLSVDMMTPNIVKIHTQLFQMKLKLQKTTNLTTLKDYLNQIIKLIFKIQNDQEKHIDINAKMIIQCDEEAIYRKNEIKDAKSSYENSYNSKNQCFSSLNFIKVLLPQLNNTIFNYKSQKNIKTDERQISKLNYLKLKEEWNKAIRFLDDFIKQIKISQGVVTSSFIDLNENLIKHVAKLGRLSDLVAIFLAMEEEHSIAKVSVTLNLKTKFLPAVNTTNTTSNTSTPNGTSNSERLEKLVTDLKTKLEADANQSNVEENITENNYQLFITTLDNLIKRLENDTNESNKHILDMEHCIENEQKIMNSASAKVIRNKNVMHTSDRTCNDFFKEFVSATLERKKEVEYLEDILGIIEERNGQIPAGISDMLEKLKGQFKVYVNKYKFKKYDENSKKNETMN